MTDPDRKYQDISASRLKQKISAGETPLLLDVREPEEFEITHLQGSCLCPMMDVLHRISEFDPKREIVVICHHGMRSEQIAFILGEHGFERVYNLAGGLEAYADIDDSENGILHYS